MNKYTSYLIRQYFLNQLIPPLESHKILGSNFLYDLVNMWIFFKLKPTSNSETDLNQEPTNYIDWDEIKRKCKEGYEKGLEDRQKFHNFLISFANFNTKNLLLKILLSPFQLFFKFVMGFILMFSSCSLLNQKQDN